MKGQVRVGTLERQTDKSRKRCKRERRGKRGKKRKEEQEAREMTDERASWAWLALLKGALGL